MVLTRALAKLGLADDDASSFCFVDLGDNDLLALSYGNAALEFKRIQSGEQLLDFAIYIHADQASTALIKVRDCFRWLSQLSLETFAGFAGKAQHEPHDGANEEKSE